MNNFYAYSIAAECEICGAVPINRLHPVDVHSIPYPNNPASALNLGASAPYMAWYSSNQGS